LIFKNNNIALGIVLALIVPLFVTIIIYFLRFSYYPFGEFLQTVAQESRLVTFVSVWCLVANIALFTLFINTNKYQTAKGVFNITILYGLSFLLLKVFI
jgi:capsular polysaccharide biosynthesis protein